MTTTATSAVPVVATTRPGDIDPQQLLRLLYGEPASVADLEVLAGLAAHASLPTWDLVPATGEPGHTPAALAPAPEPETDRPGRPANDTDIADDLTSDLDDLDLVRTHVLRGVRIA